MCLRISGGPDRAHAPPSSFARAGARRSGPQPHAAPAGHAGGALADEFDAGGIERGNQFHEGVDVAANDALAGFHPLDRRDGKPGQIGKFALIDAEKRPGGAELRSCNHVPRIN